MRFRGQKQEPDVATDAAVSTGTAEAPSTATPRRTPIGRHTGTRLGDLLIERGTLNSDQLSSALLEQAESGRRLGEILVESGFLTDRELMQALSDQLHLPLIDLRRTLPTDEALASLPESVVRSTQALPMRVADEGVAVAMAGPPTDDELAKLEAAAGRRVSVVLAPVSDIRQLIDRSYRAMAGMDRIVEAFQGEEAARPDGGTGAAITLSIDDNAPVVQVVTRILTEAVRDRASDIHVEPQGDELRIRFRVDGALHDATTLPGNMAQSLVSRLKIMAGLNIVERRRAQDGQFEAHVDGRALDVRITTAATIWGEKAVLRILDKSKSLLELSRLGMSREARDEFSRMIRTPFGMVICAGPTGSGKTTTLYAALSELNDPSRNITTIEDPVEYVFPSINQIQINEAADITFAGGLRSILRQDPDIILVGEVRDVETARIAVQSALTGHLVLSSLHAIDAAAALHRFLDMGIESFLIASSVIGVVAQRLVRRTCISCREPYEPTSEELAFYEEWGGKPKDEFLHGAGCNLCLHTGYVERVGVYELLHVTEEVRGLILRQAPHDELRAAAAGDGMRTLRDEALRLIEEDVTTISEVVRSIYLV
ncbi:MAG TPA: ATPase, T2SS/T4P/T4SS family [Acidimicrobiia bacterium]